MPNRSPVLAALMSFIFPGLGQVYAGKTRRGVIWAIPMLVAIGAVVLLVLGGSRSIDQLLTADAALTLVVLDTALFVYHVAAMVDAYVVARRGQSSESGSGRSRGAPIALGGLIVLAIVLHGLPGAYGVSYYQFASSYTGSEQAVIPQASFAPETLPPQPSGLESPIASLPDESLPGATPTLVADGPAEPTATPASATATPAPSASGSGKPKACPPAPDLSGWAPGADGRLNILLVGSDSRSDDGVSAASLRTDSMLLLSVDIADCKAALFSFPRNMTNVPADSITRYPDWLYIPTETGQPYNGYLFGLWRDAAANPGEYPGSEGISGADCQQEFDCERGWRALTYAIQQMSGVNVDGVIAVNLKGFVDIVANLPGSGVWLDIPDPLQDDAYYNSQQQLYPVNFKPGCQFLDPEDTLAYARSRHQDSDYQRERRQQFVLTSIRKQLDPVSLLPHIPGLLSAAHANLFMTFSSDDFPYLAQVASRVDADRLYQYDFAPPHLVPLGSMAGMQAKVQNIFSEPEPEPTPQQQDNNCPPN